MSYDFHLEIDTGGGEPTTIASLGNNTTNLAPMLTAALDGTDIRDLDGHAAADAAPLLRAAVMRMLTDPEKYEAMNPANGWGDATEGLRLLALIATACARHPKTTIRITS